MSMNFAVDADSWQIAEALRLEAAIITAGPAYLAVPPDEPAELVIQVEPVVISGSECQLELFKRRLRAVELGSMSAVLMMTKNVAARELCATSHLWWGWTLVARDEIYTVQLVVFPKPFASDLLGKAERGEIYKVETAKLMPWDGQNHASQRAAA